MGLFFGDNLPPNMFSEEKITKEKSKTFLDILKPEKKVEKDEKPPPTPDQFFDKYVEKVILRKN